MDVELTLHEAAERLGVHYMTVYRYVRLGLLRADKVKGTWRVGELDLRSFEANAAAEVTDVVGRRRAPWSDRMASRLVAGDAAGAWGVIEAALSSGADLDDIYVEVLTPALRSISTRGDDGSLDVSVVRRAEVVAIRLIGRLGPRFTRRGRTRGAVVVGAQVGDERDLGPAMLADILRRGGWDVSDLGPEIPPAGFAYMASTVDGLVAIGVMVHAAAALAITAETIMQIRAAVDGVTIVLTGAAIRDHDHAVALGADHGVADGRQFGEVLERLHRSSPSDARAVP